MDSSESHNTGIPYANTGGPTRTTSNPTPLFADVAAPTVPTTVQPAQPLPPTPTQPNAQPIASQFIAAKPRDWRRIIIRAGIGALIIALLVAGYFLFNSLNNKNKQQQTSNGIIQNTTLPLSAFANSGGLSLIGGQSLTINGQLRANESFILAPSSQPTSTEKGQLYYDKNSNTLAYYNGGQFVQLAANTGVVQTLQGQSGNVTLVAGNGVTITGTTISNNGVTSFGGQKGDLTVGNGLAMSGTALQNTGITSAVAGSSNVLLSTDANGKLTISTTPAGTGTVQSPGGTSGTVALFTGAQTINNSIITQSGLTVTITGDLSVVTGGMTLSNALTVSNGGTGATSLAANGVILGNGTAALTSVAAGSPGLCLVSTAGAPAFSACPSGSGVTSLNSLTGALNIANASAAGSTITLDNASTLAKGIAQFNATNFSVAAGVVNTSQNINTTASPTFVGVNTNSVTPSAALTVGATTQQLVLQGNASTQLTATGGGFTTTVGFTGTPTGAITYNFNRALAPGTYEICSSVGNCAGSGGSVGGTGTLNQLAKFTSTGSTIGNSSISDNGTTVTTSANLVVQGGSVTVGVPNTQTGSVTFARAATLNTGTITQGVLTGNRTYTLPDATGTFCLDTGNCSGTGSTNTLQAAYDAGNAITTSDARNISIILANTVTDSNFDISIADGSTGYASISRANGTGLADPAQLILVSNLDLDRAVAAGIKIQSAAGGITNGVDATDANIVNALSVGTNDIVGTTGNITFTNFGVVGSTGNVTATGNLNLSGGGQYQVSGAQISSANLSNDANLAKLSASQTFTGNTNAFKNTLDSTNAFNVQNAVGTKLLTVDTSGAQIILGTALTSSGKLTFENVTNANTVSIVPGTPTATRTITLPNSSGIVCLDSGNCAGAGATLQTGYNFSVGGTTPKIKVNGTLLGVDIQDADTTIAANLFNIRASNGAGLGSVMFGVASTGAVTMQNASNSTTALRLLTQGGTSVLTGDTTNGKIILGQSSTLAGTLVFADGGSVNTGTITQGTLTGSRTYTLPDSTGTVCLNSGNCSGTGSTNTLQAAYDAGSTIATSNARDIAVTLQDTATDSNFTITTATNSTGYTAITRADGAGTASPAQLLLVKNNDINLAQPLGVSVQSAAGGITTAFDASGSGITNALAIGANAISGTNFSVTGAGAVTAVGVNSGAGLLQGSLGLTVTGAAASINASSNFATNINTGTSTGAVSIGNASAGALTLQSASTIGITTTNFKVSTAGVVTLAGGQTADLTTNTASTANNLTVAAGTSTLLNGTGARLNLYGGTQTDAGGIGGSVYIDGGNGGSGNGQLFIGTNASGTDMVNIGRSGAVTAIQGSVVQIGTANASTSVQIGNTANAVTQTINIGNNATALSTTTLNLGSTIGTSATTIQGGSNGILLNAGAGSVKVKNGTDSSSALTVHNAADTEVMLSVDTTARSVSGGNLVKIGNSTGTDAATTILQLDSSTADPTTNLAALNGGLFYNSTSNKVSAIQNGAVRVLCNTTDSCGTNINSIGTLDSQTKSANGAVIASNALVLQSADASFPGLVTTGTQTFAGAKTFNGVVTLAGGQARDLTTTVTAGQASALSIQPGITTNIAAGGATNIKGGDVSSGADGTGGSLTLQGGSVTGASGFRFGGSVSIDGGTGATGNGAINIGTNNNTSVTIGATTSTGTITLGQSTATNTINIGTGAISNGNLQNIFIGTGVTTGTGSVTTVLGNGGSGSQTSIYGGTAGVTIASGQTSTASTTSGIVSLYTGNAAGTTSNSGSLYLSTGSATSNSGNISIDTGTATGTTGSVLIGTSNASSLLLGGVTNQTVYVGGSGVLGTAGTVHIADASLTLQTVTIGSNGNLASTTAIQGGNGANAITLNTQTTGGIQIGNTAGTGTITLGQSTASNTINIAGGTTATGNTQTVNIATGATGTGKSVVTVGSSNAASTTTIQGGASGYVEIATNNVPMMSFAGYNQIWLGNADPIAGTNAAPTAVNIAGTTSSTAGTAGSAILLNSGYGASTGAGSSGGTITIQPGSSLGSGINAGATLSLLGGSTSAGAGSTGGAVAITAANGTSTGTGGDGGAVTITAGNGAGTGPTNGGNITLQAGSAVGAGTTGKVLVKNAANSSTAFQIQNASSSILFNADTTSSRIGIGGITSAMTTLDVSGSIQQTGMSTPNTGAGSSNQWTELGYCTITAQFRQCLLNISIVGGNDGSTGNDTHASVYLRVKQQNALASAPYINLTLDGTTEVITKNDIVAVTTQNDVSATVVQLWGRVTNTNEQWYYAPFINRESSTNATWTWTPVTAYQVSLPAGTQTAAVYGDAVANTLTLQTATNTTTAMQALTSAGASVLNVDTTNQNVSLLSGNTGAPTTWATQANTLTTSTYAAMSVASNGYLYYIGGWDNTTDQKVVAYAEIRSDGTTGTFTNTTSTASCHTAGSAVVANGYIYVMGGCSSSTVEYAKIYNDGSVGTWTTGTALPAIRESGAAVYANGFIYYLGGHDGTSTNQATVYYTKPNGDGSLGSWTTSANPLTSAGDAATAVVANDNIYFMNGRNAAGSAVVNTIYFSNINQLTGANSAWTSATNVPTTGVRNAVAAQANGYIYIMGGNTGTGVPGTPTRTISYSKINSTSGQPGTWTSTSNALPTALYGASGTTVNGYLYYMGGTANSGSTPSYTNAVTIASTPRVQIGGSLDLVGIQGANMADGGDYNGSVGGTITAGNGMFVGSLQVQGQASFNSGANVNGPLDVTANFTGGYMATIRNLSSATSAGAPASSANGMLIDLGVANASRTTGNYFIAFGGSGTVAGKIQGGASAVAYTTTLADYAEYFKNSSSNQPQPGELVALDPSTAQGVTRADTTHPVFGVISTSPGFIGNGPICSETDTACDSNYQKSNVLVALNGQVPVKVSVAGGAIHIGDPITASGTPGVGQKATSAGMIVGYAEENAAADGTIKVLIQPSYYAPNNSVQGNSFADINVSGTATINNLTVTGAATVASLTVTGNANFHGNVVVHGLTTVADIVVNGHIITGGSTPVASALVAAGAGATVSVTGDDTAGTITITIGSGATADNLAKVSFGKAYTGKPNITLTPVGRASASAQAYVDQPSTTDFQIGITGTPHAGEVYVFTYHTLQ